MGVLIEFFENGRLIWTSKLQNTSIKKQNISKKYFESGFTSILISRSISHIKSYYIRILLSNFCDFVFNVKF